MWGFLYCKIAKKEIILGIRSCKIGLSNKSAEHYLEKGCVFRMQNIDRIQESLDYIEENLQAQLQVEELADMAGYSLFHYYRVFQRLVGFPVMQYITRRKLLHAAFDIANGKKIIDVALLYGFETNAGFYKAFLREFQCAPSEYIVKYAAKHPYKIKLIQEEHIMLSYKKIREVLRHWCMQDENITDFYYAGSGKRSDCEWNVGEDYVIKAGTNVAGLERHIKISRALAEHGFGVALPVETVDGKDYYWDGELYFCLESKLKGVPVKSSTFYETEPDISACCMGEILGQLDMLLARFHDEFVCNEPDLLQSMKEWAIPKVKKLVKLPESFWAEYVNVFSELYVTLPKQIIHRNPCPNSFVSENGNIVGITDFELSEKNIRIFDVCYMTTAILSENFQKNEQEQEKWFRIFEDIVIGYDSVVKLSEAEKRAIPYVVFSIQFTCIAYFSDFEKYKELTDINLAMLEWLVQNREKLSVV